MVGRRLIGPWLDRIAGPSDRLARRLLDVQPDERVLEVGFGGGALLRALLTDGAGEVIGIDASAPMVARARRRFRREIAAGRALIAQASVETLPLEPASFDGAVSVASLYFWPDPAAALAELARVIRPGGRLVLCFEPAEELSKWPGHRFGARLFEADEVERMLGQASFAVRTREIGHGRKPDRLLCLSAERRGANG